MVRHLHVDLVRREQFFTSPAFFDDLHQFGGDVDTPTVIPAVLKPSGQLVGSVVIQNIHVQLALMGKSGQCKVAAAQIAGDGVDGIGAEQQVELRVERVAQEQLDYHLACL